MPMILLISYNHVLPVCRGTGSSLLTRSCRSFIDILECIFTYIDLLERIFTYIDLLERIFTYIDLLERIFTYIDLVERILEDCINV